MNLLDIIEERSEGGIDTPPSTLTPMEARAYDIVRTMGRNGHEVRFFILTAPAYIQLCEEKNGAQTHLLGKQIGLNKELKTNTIFTLL